MKRINNIVLLGILGCLVIALVVITYVLKGNGDEQAMVTSKVRAQSVTYTRDIDLLADNSISPTIPLSASPTASASASASITPALSPTLTATPTATLAATEQPTASPSEVLSPTVIENLPRTGWTQNVSIMFIAASVLMFLSFLF